MPASDKSIMTVTAPHTTHVFHKKHASYKKTDMLFIKKHGFLQKNHTICTRQDSEHRVVSAAQWRRWRKCLCENVTRRGLLGAPSAGQADNHFFDAPALSTTTTIITMTMKTTMTTMMTTTMTTTMKMPMRKCHQAAEHFFDAPAPARRITTLSTPQRSARRRRSWWNEGDDDDENAHAKTPPSRWWWWHSFEWDCFS